MTTSKTIPYWRATHCVSTVVFTSGLRLKKRLVPTPRTSEEVEEIDNDPTS